jgi:hypothetical protein
MLLLAMLMPREIQSAKTLGSGNDLGCGSSDFSSNSISKMGGGHHH